MAEYKLYIIDEDDWVIGVWTLRCVDDDRAVMVAFDISVDRRMELWTRDRLVESFSPTPCDNDELEAAAGGEGRFRRRRAWGVIRTPARSSPPPSWGRRNS
jgi:hypothetical protein